MKKKSHIENKLSAQIRFVNLPPAELPVAGADLDSLFPCGSPYNLCQQVCEKRWCLSLRWAANKLVFWLMYRLTSHKYRGYRSPMRSTYFSHMLYTPSGKRNLQTWNEIFLSSNVERKKSYSMVFLWLETTYTQASLRFEVSDKYPPPPCVLTHSGNDVACVKTACYHTCLPIVLIRVKVSEVAIRVFGQRVTRVGPVGNGPEVAGQSWPSPSAQNGQQTKYHQNKL